MTDERRDDVGGKVLVGVLIGIILFIFTFFINATFTIANEGKTKAFEVGERLTSMEAKFTAIQGDLSEIKMLLQRRIPNGAR